MIRAQGWGEFVEGGWGGGREGGVKVGSEMEVGGEVEGGIKVGSEMEVWGWGEVEMGGESRWGVK